MRKRIMSLVFAIMMICTLFVFPASAAERETRSVTPRIGHYRARTEGGQYSGIWCRFYLSENTTGGVQYVTARTSTEGGAEMAAGSDIRLRVYGGDINVFDDDVELESSSETLYITATLDPDEADSAKADHYVTTTVYGDVSYRTTIEWE